MSEVESEFVEMGYQILAVSPSLPGKIGALLEKRPYQYRLLSDSQLAVADEFGLVWRMPDDDVKMYLDYGIDLEDESGEGHQLLPVPAAYIIGTDGVIDFAYVNPVHSMRVSADVLLAVARLTKEADEKNE